MLPPDRHTDPLPVNSGAVGSNSWNQLASLEPQNLFASLGEKGVWTCFLEHGLPLPPFLQATPAQPRFTDTAAHLLSGLNRKGLRDVTRAGHTALDSGSSF